MSRDNVVHAALITGIFVVVAGVLTSVVGPVIVDRWTEHKRSETTVVYNTTERPDARTGEEREMREAQQAAASSVADDHSPAGGTPEPQRSRIHTRYELDRTAVSFRLYGPELADQSRIYIGFRNSSNTTLQYRFVSASVTLDGTDIPVRCSETAWIYLPPAQDLGCPFTVTNRGIAVLAGSIFDVEYELEIRSHTGPIERRYERVRVTVTDTAPFRSYAADTLSRSTFLPSETD